MSIDSEISTSIESQLDESLPGDFNYYHVKFYGVLIRKSFIRDSEGKNSAYLSASSRDSSLLANLTCRSCDPLAVWRLSLNAMCGMKAQGHALPMLVPESIVSACIVRIVRNVHREDITSDYRDRNVALHI